MNIGKKNFKNRTWFFLAFFMLLNVSFTVASNSRYTFKYLTTDDGLSDNRIQGFCRDHKNFLWIATTENGINKFDGYNVEVYEHNQNDSSSISNNAIHCVFEDSKHNLWVGTFDGLNLYNPERNNFIVFRNDSNIAGTISSNRITKIIEDRSGNVWVATEESGLNKWIPESHSFERYQNTTSTNNGFNNRITDFAEDSEGNIWIVNQGNGITKFTKERDQFVFYNTPSVNLGSYTKYICVDCMDKIWIGSFGGGFCSFDPITEKFRHIDKKEDHTGPNSNMIRSIIEEDENYLLIATDQGGVNRFNKAEGTFDYILSTGIYENGLNNNGIVSLYKDKEGILWVGTSRGGVNFHNPKASKFKQYRNNPMNRNSLSYNVVGCFYEDSQGMIWIGTDGGGVNVFDPNSETFIEKFQHDSDNPYSISGDVIRSIVEDENHEIWISTWDAGLNRYDRKTGKFYRYYPNQYDHQSISDKTIWNMTVDRENNLWLGGYDTGIDIFNKEDGIIKRIFRDVSGVGELSSNNICLFYKDGPDSMWICTNYGLNLYSFVNDSISVFNNFPDNNIRAFCKDRRGNLWAGTVTNGIYLFSIDGSIVKKYDKTNGLPDNTIHAIIEDNNGNLWISTKRGLCKFNPYNDTFRNYDETDGLVGDNLFEQAFLKTRDGFIYLGGYNGFNSFHPDSLIDNEYVPQVYINEFKMSNEEVPIGKQGSILEKHISETNEITLKWNQNEFLLGFTAINYSCPENNQFAYRLEGFDPVERGWNYVGNKREANYTNLDPGEYIFKVIAANNDGVWNKEGDSLKITIQPPIWKTIYAYVIYMVVVFGLILFSFRILLERERLKHNVELEKQKAARERELDLMKIKFFTNISHEFRTPLSLIISPIEKLLKLENDSNKNQYLQLVSRNAKRLLMLINQLLDFRKLEVGQIQLNPVHDDLIGFAKEVMQAFTDIAENKNIRMSFHSNADNVQVCFDKDKLEKVLLNLLSNAFKFTENYGEIEVAIMVSNNGKNDKFADVEIKVTDTGIGIPKDKQELVFARFFQSDMPYRFINQGSGIGLSITNEFVKLHGGTINVESEVNKGSCFTVNLPLKKLEGAEVNYVNTRKEIKSRINLNNDDEIDESHIENKPLLLLVEDNEDFRFYLKDNLKQRYIVEEASNGKRAWEKVLEKIPDLIISDVMMPEIDGIEFCKMVKTDKRSCHIPVILLTAKASTDNKVEGLETGADDYLAKPFYFEILESRIKNLIQQRELLREAFRKHIIVEPSEIEITSLDEKLLQKAFQLVEKNIDNADFTVAEFSRELGMSRAHLYQKILAITGKSPNEFIRSIRLQRATQLLKESQLSVAEIAYEVGFNNPKLFTKHFKNEYNVTPSMYNKKKE